MAQDAPYFPRAATEDQDLGGINQNFRDLSDRGKDLVGGSDVPGNKCFGADALCYNDAQSRAEVGPNGICFADDTCQTTAAVTTVLTSVSASTVNPAAFTASNTAFGPCITGSTLTITTVASKDIIFSGQLSFTADGTQQVLCSLLVNDSFSPGVPSQGIVGWTNHIAFFEMPIPLNWTIAATSAPVAGSNSFCLTCRAASGNWYMNRTNAQTGIWAVRQGP